jgi:hypothetical protein
MSTLTSYTPTVRCNNFNPDLSFKMDSFHYIK